jgi:hypothetical protein
MLGTVTAEEPVVSRDDADRSRYRRYISSPEWRRSPARLAELEASGRRCRLCDAGGESVRLEVHHRTYARLFCELPSDLTTLCSPCHREVTSILRGRRYEAREPKVADVHRPLPFPSALHDPTRS